MRFLKHTVTGIVVAAACLLAGDAFAQNNSRVSATLVGAEEVPSVSTGAQGRFTAVIDEASGSVQWTLSYSGLSSDVTMAHIHFAQPSVNGAVVVWLCRTTQSPPAAPASLPQTCPQSGTISGVFTADDVISTNQGITAGEFSELLWAMRNGLAYANVHSANHPSGEIRGQIRRGAGH
ncbi:MAG TPA: CHRD domain-containing protein [Vicinamibacterales bacterium]|nr:CHRD domain-containing protein [Vicinamibacterales bacterium]